MFRYLALCHVDWTVYTFVPLHCFYCQSKLTCDLPASPQSVYLAFYPIYYVLRLLLTFVLMGRMSADTQSKVIFLHNSGVPVSKIKKLQDLSVEVSRKSIYLLLRKYQVTCSLADRKRKPRRSCLNTEHMEFIDQAIDANSALTSL